MYTFASALMCCPKNLWICSDDKQFNSSPYALPISPLFKTSIATNTIFSDWSLFRPTTQKSVMRTVPLRKLMSWLYNANCIFRLNSQMVFCLTPYSSACFEEDILFSETHISKIIRKAVRSDILILLNMVPAVGLSSCLHLVHRLAKGNCPLQ